MTIKKSVIKKHPDKADCQGVFLVISERFERSTHSLEGCCSIQLSYETTAPFFKPNGV